MWKLLQLLFFFFPNVDDIFLNFRGYWRRNVFFLTDSVVALSKAGIVMIFCRIHGKRM